jgi:hypothetical protein
MLYKIYAMKNLSITIISLLVLSSCMSTKEAKLSRDELRREKKQIDQAMVRNAVESKKYIIKFDRIHYLNGGMIELVPRANYLIVDGEKAILNTAYIGRQFDIRPIVAINMRGRASKYAVTNNTSKGSYDIKMKVSNGGSASFDVYITISKNGYCSTNVSSLKIDNVSYSGYLVPITDKSNTSQEEGNLI